MTLLMTLFFACTSEKPQDTSEQDLWRPSFECPGQPGCETADGPLKAGASAFPITPTCFESWRDCGDDGLCPDDEGYESPDGGEGDGKYSRSSEVFLDCGCDRLCPDDPGYSGPDEGEGDGDFQAVWLAGFHNSRPAMGVHDDLWARTLVMEKGDTTIAFTVVDLIGWFHEDIEKSREMLKEQGVEIDHLMVAATHNHEGPDTMGLWGFTATSGGYDDEYATYVQTQIVESVKAALTDMREVGELKVGHVDVADVSRYTENGASNLVRDSRDPVVLDTLFRAAILKDIDGETIATLSHFGNHPEAMADENVMITSDFADPLRRSMESGVVYDSYTREGYGGVSIYINGAVGGLMTPLGVTVIDGEGTAFPPDYTFERNEAMGKVMAEHAMDALDDAQTVSDMSLSGVSNIFKLPIDNFGFQGMFLANIIKREVFDYDRTQIIDEDNIPHVQTEVGHFQLGPITFTTVPGEIVPELLIGGYDGSKVGDPNKTVIDENNPNPPDLSQAPEGPYIQDLIGGEHSWIVGLGYDELGYILPVYDFKLDDVSPWFDQAPGDHYEETNSLGPQTHGLVREQIEALLNYVSD